MANQHWFTCGFTSPHKALEFFVSLSEEPLFREAESEFWNDWRVSLSQILSGVTFYIQDRIPDFTSRQRSERKEWETYYEKLSEACQRVNGSWRRVTLPDNTLSLASWLASLLFSAREEAPPSDTEPALLDREFMVIAQDLDHERAVFLVNLLRQYATSVRVAVPPSSEGNPIYVFHVLADPARQAAFRSMWAGGHLEGCDVLQAYRARSWRVFISSPHPPIAERLNLFASVAAGLPAIFGGHPTNHAPDLLMAIIVRHQKEGETSHLLWYLAGLVFHDVVELEPVRPIPFDVVSFTPSPTFFAELERLIQDVATSGEEAVGYRLELIPTRYESPSEKRYLQIQEKIQALQEELALLESLGKGRPRLLRFSQRQLPALVDVLRAYPMYVLKPESEGRPTSERLLYLFQSYEWPARAGMAADQQGFHYLYIPASLVGTILSRLLLWWEPDDPPAEFWIDPFWGNYYFDGASIPLVHLFTPRGTALYPLIHTWDKRHEAMDQYLRTMMGRWFHGHAGVASIPNRPIYLFDRDDSHTPSSIRITVLDYDQFQPLYLKLGWLNDNLIAMDAQDLGLESFIQKMAHDVTRRELANDLSQQAEAAKETFQQTAQDLETHLAEHTLSLTNRLTKELQSLVNEIEDLTKELKETDKTLVELSHIRQGMVNLVKKGKAEEDRFQHEREQTEKYIEELEREVDDLVKRAQAQRKASEQRILRAIMAIEQTRQDLIRRIQEW